MTKKRSKKTVKSVFSKADRCTAYAREVAAGEILAGPYVRGACRRHLNDLDQAGSRGYYYDEQAAADAIAFFEEVLCLNGGQYEGKPFLLLPWQCFIVGSIFGWKRKDNGLRRFQLAYIETAKGSGKSPLAAGIGIKGLVADSEERAEIYSCATYKDQAAVLFRDAIAFYDQSPELQKRLQTSGGKGKEWNLAYLKTNSFFRIISSDKSKSGPRPHMYIADEVHEHKDGTVIGLLEKGFKFREQPLGIEITNSGHDVTSFCWERHEMGRKVACELEENDRVFAYICALDEADLEADGFLVNEAVWEKANPSLAYGLPGYDYIRKQVLDSRGMPSQLSTTKRLSFCVWTEAESPWISGEVWDPCRDLDFDDELLLGRKCWGGLDLAAVNDLTAFALMFAPCEQDPTMRLKVFFWIPEKDLRQKAETDHVPYDVWVRQKHVFTSKGAAINYGQVARFIFEESLKYDLQGIAYDRNYMKFFVRDAEREGIEIAIGSWDKEKRIWKYDSQVGVKMNPFGQEPRSMAPAIDKFERFLLQREFRHDGNPCLRWCAANVVVDSDDAGYRKMSKKKSVGRIDGITATVMACGILEETEQRSVFESMTLDEMKSRMAF